ncbi:hydrogenase small subunit [Helicobacter bizzozeronii]|uniref:hydrogenase small subunit n=1 Tax=Helicobacter bizzozeronii TaxID=56877 RepID=UPI00024E5A9C|nr:hydrogenase small subunit [Helicobacter bizzozeronii]CCF81546.1 Quinone-reactive Ni/Fe-hydrogenase small chain precursor [Helicobacter bizzozeronii CCUG 35545]
MQDSHERTLFDQISQRLETLTNLEANRPDKNIHEELAKQGLERRDFMKWVSAMTATLALPASFVPLTAKAVEMANRLPVIWLHMAECTGCSESLLRSEDPSIDSVIFDYINLEYHETIMVASGHQAEHNLEQAIQKHKGNYILLVEGGIPQGTEYFLTIGSEGRTGAQECVHAAKYAKAILAIGTCSSFGGVQAAYPNPSNAQALSKIISQPIINVPGCPPSEKNIVGNVLYLLMFGTAPRLDAYNRPTWAYGHRIHDQCERRGHFDAGEFVQHFGDENAKNGFCLYKVGCKGPYTFNNCSKLRFNSHTNWPIGAGHGCIGCSEPNFWDTMSPFEEPISNRLITPLTSAFGGVGADRVADSVGIVALSASAIGIAMHAVISGLAKNKDQSDGDATRSSHG